MRAAADERAGLVGGLLLLDGLLGWGGLLVGDALVVRVSEVLTGKGAVEVKELDKAASDGHAGAALEAGTTGPLGPLLLQYVMPAEALDLVDVGGSELVVGGVGAHGVGEGHGALDAGRLGRDLEQIAVDVTALQQER